MHSLLLQYQKRTKRKPMNSLLVLLPILLFSSLCYACASDSLYASFIQCLSNHTYPNNDISSIVYSPTNASYTSILQSYIKNLRFKASTTPKPIIIVTPLRETHVQATVICAKTAGVQLKIRSGGHDYEGISYISSEPRFIVLDMFNLRKITVDNKNGNAFVQAGANVGELYYNIWLKSKIHGFPGGACPTVGVGGHFSGGGYGPMLRKYGLSVDNVVDAEIVDVNGRILNGKSMGEDLFWAIRGGGGASFGVILSYTINLVQVPETVTVFQVAKTLEENATHIVYRWQYVVNTIDNGLFIKVLLLPKMGTVTATFIALFLGHADSLMVAMSKGFPELGLKKNDCTEMSWIQSVLYLANFGHKTSPDILLNRHSDTVSFGKRKSDYVQKPISKEGLELIWKNMIQVGKVGFLLNPYGGRMSEIPAWQTPFPHRAGNLFKIQYFVNWNDGGVEAENNCLNQIRSLYSFMTPYVSMSPRGAFLNYRDLDIGVNDNGKSSYNEGKVYGVKYFMGNFDRLVKVKTMVDPDNFFHNEQSIPTLKGKN